MVRTKAWRSVEKGMGLLTALRPPRSIRPTREGWWFLLVTIGLGLAATNTGNNLLYLLLSMLLSLIVVSGVLSEQSLRSVELRRVVPKRLHAGQSIRSRILVSNRSRWLPSLSLHIQGSASRSQYLPKLGPRETVILQEELLFPHRGCHPLPPLRVSTGYPFRPLPQDRPT